MSIVEKKKLARMERRVLARAFRARAAPLAYVGRQRRLRKMNGLPKDKPETAGSEPHLSLL